MNKQCRHIFSNQKTMCKSQFLLRNQSSGLTRKMFRENFCGKVFMAIRLAFILLVVLFFIDEYLADLQSRPVISFTTLSKIILCASCPRGIILNRSPSLNNISTAHKVDHNTSNSTRKIMKKSKSRCYFDNGLTTLA